jgi:hypothetical protein
VSASTKIRWKRYVNQLKFVHEELELVRELSKGAAAEFEKYYKNFCGERQIDIGALNETHADKIQSIYQPPAPEIAPTEYADTYSLAPYANNRPPQQETSKYQMTQDELEIHDAFHKVFKKLAQILHPDKAPPNISESERRERLKAFKDAKTGLDERKYFILLELAQKHKVSTPRNYTQQIKWMKEEISKMSVEIEAEKRTYNYKFADCETDPQKDNLIRTFMHQLFGVVPA